MYTCKGTTLYLDGIEIAYVRTYLGNQEDKWQFTRKIAVGLNNADIAAQLASALTDLVGLVKAPDKNLRHYAAQVKSALFEAERTLFEYNGIIEIEQDRKDLDTVTLDEQRLDNDDVGLGALAFDASLSEVGLAATLEAKPIFLDEFAGVSAGKTAIVRDRALVLGADMVEIPISGGIPMAPEVAKPDNWDTVIVLPNISRVQRDAILAGLRLLQQELTGVKTWSPTFIIRDIAGDSGHVIAAEDIDGLCEAFNIG